MRGLYAIADVQTLASRGLDPIAFAGAVLTARPAALQLRAKDTAPGEVERLLRALAPLCNAAGVPLVVNDRPDLAVRAGCTFVHVGQTDAPIEEVRRSAPSLAVGVSTHTLAELDQALLARPAYVAFGPVFATSSKPDARPVVGVERLRSAHARAMASGVPLVAIGGITRERATDLAGIADAVAVIGALVPDGSSADGRPPHDRLAEVAERARALHALFTRAS
jgi:thiamine-phosphate pyrophosphorylase